CLARILARQAADEALQVAIAQRIAQRPLPQVVRTRIFSHRKRERAKRGEPACPRERILTKRKISAKYSDRSRSERFPGRRSRWPTTTNPGRTPSLRRA